MVFVTLYFFTCLMPVHKPNKHCSKIKCKHCKKTIARSINPIKCTQCNNLFHKKCSTELSGISNVCKPCSVSYSKNDQKVKCQHCKKTIAKSILPIKCTHCSNLFHKKCSGNSNQSFMCKSCSFSVLPLYNLNDDKFLGTLNALDNIVSDNLNILPSFSLKSKLDKLPKHISSQTGESFSKCINSKYLTPMEFTKMNKNIDNLSVLHINICSVQCLFKKILTN